MFKGWGTWLGLDDASTEKEEVVQSTDAVEKETETSPDVLDSEVNKQNASIDGEEENGDQQPLLETKGFSGKLKCVLYFT